MVRALDLVSSAGRLGSIALEAALSLSGRKDDIAKEMSQQHFQTERNSLAYTKDPAQQPFMSPELAQASCQPSVSWRSYERRHTSML